MIKKTIKSIVALLFLTVLSLIIYGCDKKEEEKTPVEPDVPTVEEPTPDVPTIDEEFNVNFYDENNKLIGTIQKKNGEKINEKDISNIELQEGYEIDGVYLNNAKYDFEKEITENLNLIIKVKIKTFTVVFLDEDKNELKSVQVEYGKAVDESEYPVVEGFEIVSLSKDLSSIKEDMSVVCVFKQVYTIRIFDIDGNPVEEFPVVRGQKIEKINYEIPSDGKYNYTVKDWYKDPEFTQVFKLTRAVTMNMDLYPKVTATPIITSHEGLTVSILGDSISTFYASNSEINSYYGGKDQYYYPIYSSTVKTAKETWWYKAINNGKMKLGINNSWSGTEAYGTGTSAGAHDSRINTLGENGTPDIIIIFLGTNDNVNGRSVAQFKNAINTIYTKIEKKYPNAYVMCCTLGYTDFAKYYYTEQKRLDYNEAIREVSKTHKGKVIELAEVQTIDTYKLLLGDALHPNAEGMTKISERVVSTIENFIKKGITIN